MFSHWRGNYLAYSVNTLSTVRLLEQTLSWIDASASIEHTLGFSKWLK